MNKLINCLIILMKIILLYLIFFALSPSIRAEAMFSEENNANIGIKLELGNVNVDTEKTTLFKDSSFTEGEAVEIVSSTFVNKGSLSAKLSYKIDVTKEDGSILTTEELKNMVISIDLGSVTNKVEATASSLNSHSFTFVKNTSGSDIVIEPNSIGKVPVSVSYKSSTPTIKEKLKIKVTFRLIQSNATGANANMFSDEVILENTILLVPKVIEEEIYWPAASTFIDVNSKFSYSLEKMNMVFSEVFNEKNSNEKVIKNLNRAVLYIKFPTEESVVTTIKVNGVEKKIPTFDFYNLTVENPAIKIVKEEIDETNNGVRITFDLIDKYNSSDPNTLSQFENKALYYLNLQSNISKYNISGKKYDIYYDHIGFQVEFFATRLVLSSDLVASVNNSYTKYSRLPIKLTTDEVLLSFKRFNSWIVESANPANFANVQLTNEKVELEVTEDEPKNVNYALTSKNELSLKLNFNENINGSILNVKITGDAGNTLVISRKLEMQKGISMLKKSSLIEEQLVEDAVTQSSIEESEKDSTTEVENSTIVVEDPEKELMEDPVIESQEVDEVVDPSSSDTTIEINENIPEVIKEDKDVIEENE